MELGADGSAGWEEAGPSSVASALCRGQTGTGDQLRRADGQRGHSSGGERIMKDEQRKDAEAQRREETKSQNPCAFASWRLGVEITPMNENDISRHTPDTTAQMLGGTSVSGA